MFRKTLLLAACICTLSLAAQPDLIGKVAQNKSDSAEKAFQFTTVVQADATPVEDQASSGTCWSYSSGSFLESEMIKAGGPSIHLSKMYIARKSYEDKAENFVRMHGAVSWGDGGEPHDVADMYAKYGTMPEDVYMGLNYGTEKNQFGEMQAMIKGMLDAVISAPNHGKLTPVWSTAVSRVLDTYLGEVPATFQYNGKTYDPKSFAKEVVRVDPDDLIEFVSETDQPYYQKTMMMVPDNWAFQLAWNVPMADITTIIDNALQNGHTVAWGGDVSEKTFSWKNGIAYVAEKDYSDMSKEEKADLFNGPKPEPTITPEMRQEAFDNYTTTDDHGMHITGIAKDQNGKEWYIVKNSWGTDNERDGYIYMSKAFVQYKTTGFMVNKKALPAGIKKKLGV
ncbi:MAG: aminopeptidase [Flavobacteriales bacterium]|nr:aminopeptidase [Flavobacteriales bacterium]MCB9193831.1 aminopeptidase [Flavobacteriales bacterium]